MRAAGSGMRKALLAFAASTVSACAPAGVGSPSSPIPLPTSLAVDSASARVVTPGVTHRRFVVDSAPWVIHVVEVDLRRADLELRAEHAFGRLEGRERTSELARRVAGDSLELIAAVNADFFSLGTGEAINNQVVEGRLWTGVGRAALGARQPRSHFALTRDRRPMIERFVMEGMLATRTDTLPLAGVNVPLTPLPRGALVLRTHPSGETLPRDTTGTLHGLRLREIARQGDTVRYVVMGTPRPAAELRRPADGALLVTREEPPMTLSRFVAHGDTIAAWWRLAPAHRDVRTLVGGWTRLVRDGVALGDSTSAHEGAAVRTFVHARHPRTAVGFSRDSTTLQLVIVDGRQAHSAGMTIPELARTMQALGAYQAVNLDGGGSTALVLEGRVINVPSDAGGERSVGNALVLVRRK